MADIKAATLTAQGKFKNASLRNLASAFLEWQDALKVALAQSREDHNSMLAALGESIRLREDLEKERHLGAEKQNKHVDLMARYARMEQERKAQKEVTEERDEWKRQFLKQTHRAENAERLRDEVTYESAQEIDRQITAKQAAEQRLAQAEESLRGIITAEKRGETAEYLAHIAARALQPAAPQSHESLPDDRTAESHESAPAAAQFGLEDEGSWKCTT